MPSLSLESCVKADNEGKLMTPEFQLCENILLNAGINYDLNDFNNISKILNIDALMDVITKI